MRIDTDPWTPAFLASKKCSAVVRGFFEVGGDPGSEKDVLDYVGSLLSQDARTFRMGWKAYRAAAHLRGVPPFDLPEGTIGRPLKDSRLADQVPASVWQVCARLPVPVAELVTLRWRNVRQPLQGELAVLTVIPVGACFKDGTSAKWLGPDNVQALGVLAAWGLGAGDWEAALWEAMDKHHTMPLLPVRPGSRIPWSARAVERHVAALPGDVDRPPGSTS